MKYKYPVGTLIYNQKSCGRISETPEYMVTRCHRDERGRTVYDLCGYSNKHSKYPDIMEMTIDSYHTTLPYIVKLDDRLFEI